MRTIEALTESDSNTISVFGMGWRISDSSIPGAKRLATIRAEDIEPDKYPLIPARRETHKSIFVPSIRYAG
jgi:hypothetical protein